MISLLPLQGAEGAITALFGLLTLAVLIVAVVWTYRDAKRNSDQPAFLWAIVVFLAPLLGIILYFLLGRN